MIRRENPRTGVPANVYFQFTQETSEEMIANGLSWIVSLAIFHNRTGIWAITTNHFAAEQIEKDIIRQGFALEIERY